MNWTVNSKRQGQGSDRPGPLRCPSPAELYEGFLKYPAIGTACTLVEETAIGSGGFLSLRKEGKFPRLAEDVSDILSGEKSISSQGERRVPFFAYLYDALVHAQIYGAFALVLDLDDGRPLDQPVDLKNLQEIREIKAFLPWEIVPYFYGALSRNLSPKYYQILGSQHLDWGLNSQGEWRYYGRGIVHESRVLAFRSSEFLPRRAGGTGLGWLDGWGSDSLVRRMLDAAIGFYGSLDDLKQAIGKGKSTYFQSPELRAKREMNRPGLDPVSGRETTYQEKAQQRLNEIANSENDYNVTVIDSDENLVTFDLTFSGYADVHDRFKEALVQASGLPEAWLFSTTPSNAGILRSPEQRSSLIPHCDECREFRIDPHLKRILTYLFASKLGPTKGQRLKESDYEWEWRSPFPETEEERAERFDKEVQALERLARIARDQDKIAQNGGQPLFYVSELRRQFSQSKLPSSMLAIALGEGSEDTERGRRPVRFRGLSLVVEFEPGARRHGKILPCAYGYIEGTAGDDGDEIDCYLGGDLDSDRAFIIEQLNRQGGRDEDKVMLGFADEEEARETFLKCKPPRWLGAIRGMAIAEFVAQYVKTAVPEPDLLPSEAAIEEEE